VLEVHGDPAVPIIRRDVFGRVPLVVRGIVDEDVDRAEGVPDSPDRVLQRRDVRQVRALERYDLN
jgi:hypothetical protein